MDVGDGEGIARPVRVTATGSTGVAHGKGMKTEDSITLTVQWENRNDGTLGCIRRVGSHPRAMSIPSRGFFTWGRMGRSTSIKLIAV